MGLNCYSSLDNQSQKSFFGLGRYNWRQTWDRRQQRTTKEFKIPFRSRMMGNSLTTIYNQNVWMKLRHKNVYSQRKSLINQKSIRNSYCDARSNPTKKSIFIHFHSPYCQALGHLSDHSPLIYRYGQNIIWYSWPWANSLDLEMHLTTCAWARGCNVLTHDTNLPTSTTDLFLSLKLLIKVG